MKRIFSIVLFLTSLVACVHPATTQSGTASLTGLAALDNNPHLVVNSIAITPSNESHVVGQTIGYTALATLSNGQTYNVTNVSSWASNNPSIASFQSLITLPSPVANFICSSQGLAQITVQFGGLQATTGITCRQTPPPPSLVSIAIGGGNNVSVGQSAQFSATGTYSDGTTSDVTGGQTVWSSGTTTVAKIGALTATQSVACIRGGSSVITVTNGTVTQTVTLTCNAVLVSIAVTPSTATVVVGAQPTFVATGTYNDTSTQNVTLAATWTSSNTTVARAGAPVSNPETFSALAAGSSTITATIGSISNTASLTVTSSGPAPPTLVSGQITPTTVVVNVGSSTDLTHTGTFSDTSTQNITNASNWSSSNTAVASLQLKDAILGTVYSTTLTGTGASTPYEWSVSAAPMGTKVDLLDYATMPLPTRNTSHLSGATGKYFHLDAGLLWWMKGASGHPWDGLAYDGSFIYDWFTEDGDASDQAACQAAGFTSCFVDPFAYKMFLKPISAMPRYFTLGSPTVWLTHPSPNNFTRTTNCGVDNQAQINLGNIVEGTNDGDYLAGTSTRAFGGSVGTQHTIERLHFWGLSSVAIPPQSGHLEVFDLVLGFGQVEWRNYHWGGSSWVLDQDSLDNNVVAGGAPTPVFSCNIPVVPLAGGLPSGQLSPAHPQFNLTDTTGTISGTPTKAGTYPFVVQQEEANGTQHLQSQTIRVTPDVAHVLQTVTCNTAGSATITATDGSVTSTRTVTCQSPTATLVSIAIKPTSPTVGTGLSIPLTATGTYSDSSTQDLSASATWTSSNTSVALIATSGTPRNLTCNTVGTSGITAQVGAVTSPTDTVSCVTPVTGNGNNIFCTGTSDATCFTGNQTDGPAALPTSGMYTNLNGTPSPGTVHTLSCSLSALQTAINAGACGDTYTVPAGCDLGTGTINLPAKSCDNAHWNLLESAGATDPNFPPEGTEATPCVYNTASMPGRNYPCPTVRNLGATISAGNASNAIRVNGGDHWIVRAFKITRVPTGGVAIFNLIDLSSSSTQTNHIIFSGDWCAGIENTFPSAAQSTDTSTTRCIFLGQANHIAMVDSYCTNFYTTTSRSANGNSDSQCIGGGFGSIANSGWGTYKFVNDHIEAASEGILLGGSVGPPLTPPGCTIMVNCNLDVPTDIEVRHNYFFKPLGWNGNTTQPGGTGWPVVKNGWEMKIGARALFEANVVENVWYNAQVGYCWSTAPKNQSGGSPLVGTAPTALTNDFTYRYNYCYNAAYGFGLYQSMDSGCSGCQAQGANGVSIHDNVVGDNLNLGSLSGQSAGDEMEFLLTPDSTNQGLNQINHVQISNNTFVKGVRSLMIIGGGNPAPSQNQHSWVFQNNVGSNANFGSMSITSATSACDGGTNFNILFKIVQACISGVTWDHNAVFNWNQGALGTNWPTNGSGLGNLFFTSATAVGFSNYGTGDSGFNPLNYQMNTNSPLHNAGSNGKDIGADTVTLNQKIQGVRQ